MLFALRANAAFAKEASLDGLKSRITGTLDVDKLRIAATADPADPGLVPRPTCLKRDFTFDAGGGFDAIVTVVADPTRQVPAVSCSFAGDMVWHGEDPTADGAWSQDYLLNKQLELTVLAPPVAEQMNQLSKGASGERPYPMGKTRDILGNHSILLRFAGGSEYVTDRDFLYARQDMPNMQFMGGKHVDGTGVYYPQNRPVTGFQQPLVRMNQPCRVRFGCRYKGAPRLQDLPEIAKFSSSI